jgi:hypothetical protein
MARTTRRRSDKIHKGGKTFKELCGSRKKVWNRTAYKTTGGLTRDKLILNKWGRIVSRKMHKRAKKEKRLEKLGFKAKKGKFGVERVKVKGGAVDTGASLI